MAIRLEHFTNAFLETFSVSQSHLVPCFFRKADNISKEPCNSRSSARKLGKAESYFVYQSSLYGDDFNVKIPY